MVADYEAKQRLDDPRLCFASEITEISKASRSNYGTRKIKKERMKTWEFSFDGIYGLVAYSHD